MPLLPKTLFALDPVKTCKISIDFAASFIFLTSYRAENVHTCTIDARGALLRGMKFRAQHFCVTRILLVKHLKI